MTIEAIPPIITYAENGTTVDFAVPFEFILPEFLEVTRTDPAGARTPLTLGADYLVFGGDFDFGSIQTTAPAPGGWQIEIARNTPQEQPMDYTPNDTFPAESHEDALDREMMCIQELERDLGILESRALRVPRGETINELPPAAERAGKYPRFLPDGSLTVDEGTGGGGSGTIITGGSIGLFINAAAVTLLAGADYVQTSGFAVIGQGAAFYLYDAAVDAAYVAANPLTSFRSINGRGYRLDPQQRLTIEMFGGRADCSNTSWNYFAGNFVTSGPALTGTDNLAAINAAMAFTEAWSVTQIRHTKRIHFEGEAGQSAYGFSGPIVPKNVVHLVGNSNGHDTVAGTMFRFPPNTVGIEIRRNIQNNAIDEEAGGSTIEGIYFYGGGGTDRSKHGLYLRARANIRDCVFDSFAGDNVHHAGHASAAVGDPEYGFTSGTHTERVLCRMAGNWNCKIVGSDSSASNFYALQCRISRLGGIWDASYFGCTFHGVEIDDYGNARVGGVHRGGKHYLLIDATAGIGAATTPGTALTNHIWYEWEAGGVSATWPEWSAANTYEVSVPIFGVVGTYIGGYIEIFYPAHIIGAAKAYGVFGAWTNWSASDFKGSTQSLAFYSRTGYGCYQLYPSNHPILGSYFEANIGGYFGQGSEGNVWGHRAGGDGDLSWQYSYTTAQRDLGYRFGGSGRFTYEVTGPNTTEQAGSGVAQPRYLKLSGFMLADQNGVNVRRHHSGTAAPGSGTWAKGDIVWNVNPAASGKIGWVCTATGSPGTWKPFGAIDA